MNTIPATLQSAKTRADNMAGFSLEDLTDEINSLGAEAIGIIPPVFDALSSISMFIDTLSDPSNEGLSLRTVQMTLQGIMNRTLEPLNG